MRRTFHKLFWIWELDKEEAWINEMASHGYSLVHAGRFHYVFEETEPDRYTYKTLFISGSATSQKNIEYFRFLEEMGIEAVTSVNYPGTCWVMTRALKEDYPDGIELYSDIDSKLKYMRVNLIYTIFAHFFLCFAAALNLTTGFALFNRPGSLSGLNIFCGGVLIALSVLSLVAIIRTIITIVRLKKERNIHE